MLMLVMMRLLSFAITEWLTHQPPYASLVDMSTKLAYVDGTEVGQPPRRPHLAGLQARAPSPRRTPQQAHAPGLRNDRDRLRGAGRGLRAPGRTGAYLRTHAVVNATSTEIPISSVSPAPDFVDKDT